MNISQMRKLTVLAVKPEVGKPLEQRLKTLCEALTLLLTAAQGAFRAAQAAGADEALLDELAEDIDEVHTKQARCAHVLRDIKAQLDARAAGKTVTP